MGLFEDYGAPRAIWGPGSTANCPLDIFLKINESLFITHTIHHKYNEKDGNRNATHGIEYAMPVSHDGEKYRLLLKTQFVENVRNLSASQIKLLPRKRRVDIKDAYRSAFIAVIPAGSPRNSYLGGRNIQPTSLPTAAPPPAAAVRCGSRSCRQMSGRALYQRYRPRKAWQLGQ